MSQGINSKYTTCIICADPLSAENTTWYRQKNHIHKCNDCTREEKRAWAAAKYKKFPNKILENGRRSRAKLKSTNPIRYTAIQMTASARKRAFALALPYDLTSEKVESLCIKFCPILGYELKYGGGDKTKMSASLDRIEPAKGYIMGNVMIVCMLANLMKNEASMAEMVLFSKWIEKIQGKAK